ncbi:MAG: DUF885 domain-containing protein [Proteobacteria bacterium]|nr:DUF885 domain-containing protein [Pseudomonadota bacterium]MDA0958557.1 DUF885 domain-containing protein [Pseudomonadota bacterium]
MKQIFVIAISIFVALIGGVKVADADVGSRPAAQGALYGLFEEAWELDMQDNPVWASMLGDRRFNRAWGELSAASFERRRMANAAILKRLDSIDQESLSPQDQINFLLFDQAYESRMAEAEHPTHLMPISQRGGIQTLDEIGDRLRLETVQDFDDWLARLAQIDQLMQQTIALMKEGMASGYVPPKITMSRVPGQIAKQLVSTAEESLFFKPFEILPNSIAPAQQARLQSEARSIITETVIPAYQTLEKFFNEEYLPACRDSIGASDLPNGAAFYEYRVRRYTTTDMTPEEVHQVGLTEVQRIRNEMMAVKAAVGFEGSLDAFFNFLRTDPQFYFEDPEDLLRAYEAQAKRIDPELVRLFTKLPRMPYGIKVIPEAVAPDTTTAYYTRPAADGSRAGYYWVNLYNPASRPKFEIPVLTVHEAMPGHHLQIALQQELESLPNFRRYSGFTVFTEGWGLYSERLGYDIGLYQDPYDQFGQLSYDMWRAVRLVVDTGMHYKGWSRDEAIAYFERNAPRKKLDIINEIDRYISWPGQALAYKIGQLKMLALRDKASSQLGDRFDLKRFHDRMLSQGAIPLSLLEITMDQWIESELRQVEAVDGS